MLSCLMSIFASMDFPVTSLKVKHICWFTLHFLILEKRIKVRHRTQDSHFYGVYERWIIENLTHHLGSGWKARIIGENRLDYKQISPTSPVILNLRKRPPSWKRGTMHSHKIEQNFNYPIKFCTLK